MQHSKWATSNSLFDYNSFINDFYALIEEYNSYKERTEEIIPESQQVKVLTFYLKSSYRTVLHHLVMFIKEHVSRKIIGWYAFKGKGSGNFGLPTLSF